MFYQTTQEKDVIVSVLPSGFFSKYFVSLFNLRYREWEANNDYVLKIQELQKWNCRWVDLLVVKLKLGKSSHGYFKLKKFWSWY